MLLRFRNTGISTLLRFSVGVAHCATRFPTSKIFMDIGFLSLEET